MALRELIDLRQDASEMCADLARIELAIARGTRFPQDLTEVVRAHRLACSRDGLAQVVEALAGAEGPARIARLASLRDFLVRARALALEPDTAQELLEWPGRPSVRLPGDPGLHGAQPPVAVERELPFVREREKRAQMEAALAEAERGVSGARSASWEAAQAALSLLDSGDPAEAALALHERGWAPPPPATAPPPPAPSRAAPSEGSPLLAAAAPAESERDPVTSSCEQFLRDTDAVALDLGGWLLERHTGVRAAPRGAERHDLLRFLHAPGFAGAFPRGELVRTVRRWAEMLRLDMSAGGAIRLDEQEHPLQPLGARAVALDPPHEVRIVVLPAEGPRALGDLLAAVGRARLRAGPPADAPPEDLWLGDAALEPACGALLSGLLLDDHWLLRCAHAELPPDDRRALWVAALLEARLEAGRALAALEAHRAGLSRGEQAYRELHARAALSDLPGALALRDLDPWLSAWAALRGRAFAARLRESLRDRFDEDWWRNPRALAALQAPWSRGGRPTLAELWSEVGGTPSLEPLSAELARACA